MEKKVKVHIIHPIRRSHP